MALLPGSAAIGNGTTASGVTTDQRGIPLDRRRPDIGAFQIQSSALDISVNSTYGGLSAPFGNLSLSAAVNLANVLPGAAKITFAPNVFGTAQTITLTSGQLELKNKSGTETITGPVAGVTVSGGGLSRVFQVDQGVIASILGLTITGGKANQGGGLLNLGTVTETNCTLSDNTAVSGGGLSNVRGLRATLINCTISSNTATGKGGGVFDSGGPLNLINCTVSGNAAETGGGIANAGAVTMRNSIVAANTAATAPDFSGVVVSQGNNLIGKDDGSSGWIKPGAGNSDLTGTIAKPLDPLLAPLGHYGGPTQTMALLPGSPAIGAGSTGVVPADLTTDQRGMPRGSLVDIGAFQTSLVVQSTSGSVITAPIDQLTLPGAVSLAKEFAGPIAISFSPTVFGAKQSITLAGNQLELSKTGTLPILTITGPTADLTVSGGGLSRVFQVDPGVTASISGLTIAGGGGTADRGGGLLNLGGAHVTLTKCTVSGNTASTNGGGLANYGVATLADCTVSNNTVGGSGAGLFSSGGTLTVKSSTVAGQGTAVQFVAGASATITGGLISTGAGTGIMVGSSPGDAWTVAVHNVDLSANKTGVLNDASRPVDATLDWWGSGSGPGSSGASNTAGLVNASPWLGDAQSLKLATPDSLGFASKAGDSYVVAPISAGPGSPKLRTARAGGGNSGWFVTPTGTISFVGSGGGVTINGETGTGFDKNAFTITNEAVAFAADDAFKGATIRLSGNISRTVDARGTTNTFDVSVWTGAGTLTAPKGAASTVVASSNAGYTLTDTSIRSTSGLNGSLKGITAANLTVTTTSGDHSAIDASAFTGATNLTVAGTGTAILFGGKGRGTLTATGSGNNVLIGGPGENKLRDNGIGSNILIGGGGPNRIYGNGNDILLSGTTIYDHNTRANHAALDAILSEWASNNPYTERVLNILDGIQVGLNTYELNQETVRSNGKSSTLSDGPRQLKHENWFIVNAKDAVTQRNELVTMINT
jgi:hypothetical protein